MMGKEKEHPHDLPPIDKALQERLEMEKQLEIKVKGFEEFLENKKVSKKHLKKSLSLQKKLMHVFGNKITENKKISIDLLAQEAFSNETNHKILNGIMWPEILILINRAYENAKKNKFKLFIVDAALIFEANFTSFFDKVILISTKKSTRIDRAIKRNNLSLESIQNRIHLQMSESEKKKLTDTVIVNNSSIESLYKKLDELYLKLL